MNVCSLTKPTNASPLTRANTRRANKEIKLNRAAMVAGRSATNPRWTRDVSVSASPSPYLVANTN